MTHRFAGMSLIELLVTIAIIGIVTVFAVPSFRGLQGRQDMRVAQGVIQSALYRLDQLALAPPAITQDTGQLSDFDIVGYGLIFYSSGRPGATPVTVADCSVTVTNDFIATVKYIRYKSNNNAIRALLVPVDPWAPGPCRINARNYPDDIYALPQRVSFSQQASDPDIIPKKPWIVTQTLASVGTSVGELETSASYTYPFLSTATPKLAVKHRSIRSTNAKGDVQALCYGISFSRYSNAIQTTSKVTDGCTP